MGRNAQARAAPGPPRAELTRYNSCAMFPAARILLALVLLVAAAVPARAQDEDAMLLVAHPGFRDIDYRQTVLLAAPAPNGGHVGVMLNRPTRRSLASLFPEHEPS